MRARACVCAVVGECGKPARVLPRASEPAPEAGSRAEVEVAAIPWPRRGLICAYSLLPFCWEYRREVKARLGDPISLGLHPLLTCPWREEEETALCL